MANLACNHTEFRTARAPLAGSHHTLARYKQFTYVSIGTTCEFELRCSLCYVMLRGVQDN